MNKIVIFDGRYATSIASAAVVILKHRSAQAIDITQVNSKKGLAALKDKINKAGEAFVMVDDLGIKHNKDAKVTYISPPKGKKHDKRVLSVWAGQNTGKPAPLLLFILGGGNTPKDRLNDRKLLSNAIPIYLDDLAGGDIQKWSRLLEGQQDVAFMDQLIANGLIIENYKERFGTEDTDKVDAKELAASKAKLAELGDNAEALRDSEEEVKRLESDGAEKDEEIEKLGESITSIEARVEEAEGKADKAVESAKEAKDLLADAQQEAKDAKSVVTDKEKELKSVRGDLDTASSRLEKAEDGAVETKEAMEAVKNSLTESRSDYDKSQEDIVGLKGEKKALEGEKKDLEAGAKKLTAEVKTLTTKNETLTNSNKVLKEAAAKKKSAKK